MKRTLLMGMVVSVGFFAVEAMGQELLPAPEITPTPYQSDRLQPVPDVGPQGFEFVPQRDFASHDPAPSEVEPMPYPAPMVTLPPAMHSPFLAPLPQAPAHRQVALYPHVRVKDAHRVHPEAVRRIVEVPDPRDKHCTVFVEICEPPCGIRKIKRGLLGRKVTFDYGKYEVKVTSRRGVVTVNYNS